MKVPSFVELKTTLSEGVYFIQFNRPKRKNAFNFLIMDEIVSALKFATEEPEVRVVVITGEGDHFSSGNDLTNFTKIEPTEDGMKQAKSRLYRFVDAFITFPKILIAAVNGSAIGIGCTLLSHFDFIYAYEKATFKTPFSELGQTPEACSSVLFPELMGKRKAQEMLILGKELVASELRGLLVTETFPDPNSAVNHALAVAKKLSADFPECVVSSKRLLSENKLKFLQQVNFNEIEELEIRWKSPECLEAVMRFLTKKTPPTSKL